MIDPSLGSVEYFGMFGNLRRGRFTPLLVAGGFDGLDDFETVGGESFDGLPVGGGVGKGF